MKKILLAILCLWSVEIASASQLKIVASPQFQISKIKEGLLIRGTYSIQNRGDEKALEVYPQIDIDLFQLQGKPVDLEPGAQKIWTWKEIVPNKKLCVTKNALCSVALPLAGQMLIRSLNYYKDGNGYPFAVPQLAISSINGGDTEPSKQAELVLKIKKTGEQIYRGDYEVHNKLDVNMDLKLDIILPQEVEILNPVQGLLLKDKASLFGAFQFKNNRGLNGSRYYAYFTAQWEMNGERKVAWAFAPFTIGQQQEEEVSADQPKPSFKMSLNSFWWIWLVVAIVGFLLMIQFWVRPLKKL